MLEIKDARQCDCSELSDLDRQCFRVPYTAEDFEKIAYSIRDKVMTWRCDASLEIYGYMHYEFSQRNFILLHRIATHPDLRRRGYASRLVDNLKTLVSPKRTRKIKTLIPESHFEALNFFKSMSFDAVGTDSNPWTESADDGIWMVFDPYRRNRRIPLRNRITKFRT